MTPRPSALAQGALAVVALSRLARGQRRRGPLEVPAWVAGDAGDPSQPTLSVVIPARDEAARIAGVLGPLASAPGVLEVIVVDDRSTDGTAELARSFGARVISGTEPPIGWIGKPWALQQGLVAAQGELVVFLDADVSPEPVLPAAIAALLDDADLASAQLAFTCPDAAQRVLHPALLATLIYRTGPLDTVDRMPASIAAMNGQCFAVRRRSLIAAGGFGLISAIPTDDVALARALSAAGWRLVVVDGSALGSVRMYESAGEAMREWAGRSLALPGASHRPRQLVDLAVVWAVQGLPGLRLWRALLRGLAHGSLREAVRALGPLDLALLGLRGALQLALLSTYRRVGVAGDVPSAGARVPPGGPDFLSLLAPLADPIAAAALTRGTFAPVREWRGREV